MKNSASLSAKAALKINNTVLTTLYSDALREGGVDLPARTLEKAMNTHPNFPGFKAFHEWASDHGLKLRVFQGNPSQLSKLVPCLAFFRVSDGRLEPLAMIRDTRDGEILLDDEHGLHWEPVEKIQGYNCEIFVKVSAPETPSTDALTSVIRENTSEIWRKRMVLACVFVALIIALAMQWVSAPGLSALGLSAHFILSIVGIGLAVELVSLTLGRNAGLAPNICEAAALAQSGCGSALTSPLSKIVPWIGLPLATLGYFLVMALAVGLGAGIAGLHGWVMIISAGAIVAGLGSLYYQAVVLREWCHLCCLMIGVMALQAVAALLFVSSIVTQSTMPEIAGAMILVCLFATVFAILVIAEPYLEGASEYENVYAHYKQLLQKPQIQIDTFRGQAFEFGSVDGDIVLGDMSEDAAELALVVSLGCNGCAITIADVERLRRRFSDGVRVRIRLAIEQPNVYFDIADTIVTASADGRHEDAFSILLAEVRNPTKVSRHTARRADPADYSEALRAQLRWYKEVQPPTVPLTTFNGYIYRGQLADMRYLIEEVAADICATRLKKSA